MSRMVTAPGRAREYETIYILKPDVDAESAEEAQALLEAGQGHRCDSGAAVHVELGEMHTSH